MHGVVEVPRVSLLLPSQLGPAPALPAPDFTPAAFVGVPVTSFDDVACSVHHISPERPAPARPAGGLIEFSGRVLRVVGFGGGNAVPVGKRGAILDWSRSSRMRLLRTCMGIEWEAELGELVMVTLTYPGRPELVPHDGRLVHRHLQRFLQRWERRYGKPRGLWKMEFQARGAAHFHLFLAKPVSVGLGRLRKFVAWAWWRAVRSEDRDHLRAGTQVIRWHGDPTAYAWKYLKAYGSEKEYQHHVPPGFRSVGRWWGLINVEPRVVTIDLSADQFTRARRVLRGWRRATTGYRLRVFGAAAGFWLFTAASSRGLVDALMRAIT